MNRLSSYSRRNPMLLNYPFYVGNAIPLVSLCNMQPGRQEDAQEFLLNLLESLRNDLGDQENSVNIFAGEMTNYIKCKDVMFMKESKERFHDISLDIADYSNLQDALDGFFTPVTLEGSNQYNTKTHGRQDAIKGIRISRLPKVLFIHLKRFGFDIETNEMRKIPKALEFPMNLCLDKYVDITDKVGGNVEGLVSNYQLNAVILHDGNGDAGHYTCFVKTNDRNIHDTWYRLNDEVFGIVDTDTVMEESSGRVPNVQRSDNGISKNGYILQYVKTEKNTD